MSSAYRSLHINTSRERMEYSDFPMPKSYPDFPHHTHIAKYFDDYVDHFGIRDRIRFETGVERVARRRRRRVGGRARRTARRTATTRCWSPTATTGTRAGPSPPSPAAEEFEGVQIHSHDYKGDDPDFFRDKTVVVLGMGNSAMDIAVEASFVAQHTYLAARRGAHVIPKYLFGKPIDQIGGSTKIPFPVRRRVLEGMLKVYLGDMERYGLPKPDHRFGGAHPTVSDDILSRMAHGTITAKPNIASLTRDGVRFADGSEVEADVVVYCTGYKVTFPFFDAGFIAAPDNDLPLFRRTFHPDIPNVFFIGLLQPLGAIMPIAELQSEWVSDFLAGRYALPSPGELRADIEAERRSMFKRYVASKRHTMQIDYDDWIVARREGAQGGRGARAGAGQPPAGAAAGGASPVAA